MCDMGDPGDPGTGSITGTVAVCSLLSSHIAQMRGVHIWETSLQCVTRVTWVTLVLGP